MACQSNIIFIKNVLTPNSKSNHSIQKHHEKSLKKILPIPKSKLYLSFPCSVELQKVNLAQDANATQLPSLPSLTSSANTTGNTSTNNGPSNTTNVSTASNVNPLAAAFPLAQLLSKPSALNALTSLSALGGLTDLLSGLSALSGPPIQTTGAHRPKQNMNSRLGRNNNSNNSNGSGIATTSGFSGGTDPKRHSERSKFNPY